ncbi:hypothetical protein EG329_008610 [Mollisiaceae sp. DMI_Dod_QoI]|nr:hypothetical protein EG329_008610 [Helotiales sp. DMI_Dod_QoI]
MADKPDLVQRGKYGSTPLSNTIFIGLRTADLFLQYGILAKGLADPLLNLLHVTQTPNLAPAVAFGLPLKPLLMLAMAAGSTLKQSYWAIFISKEQLPAQNSFIISTFNTLLNSINSMLALTAAANAFLPSVLTKTDDHGASIFLILSSVSYLLGLFMEAVSETQRKAFKDDPKNAGKLYTGGLFSLARHINYGGYTIWRASYALAAGGWIWGGISAAWFTYDFTQRAIPILDHYCTTRYGASWVEYKKKTPYLLVPGVL